MTDPNKPIRGQIYYLIFTDEEPNKIYVGKTIIGIRNRMTCHRHSSRAAKPKFYLYLAIQAHSRKLGISIDEFWKKYITIQIIHDITGTIDEINELEVTMIEAEDSTNPAIGYNLHTGGRNGKYPTAISAKSRTEGQVGSVKDQARRRTIPGGEYLPKYLTIINGPTSYGYTISNHKFTSATKTFTKGGEAALEKNLELALAYLERLNALWAIKKAEIASGKEVSQTTLVTGSDEDESIIKGAQGKMPPGITMTSNGFMVQWKKVPRRSFMHKGKATDFANALKYLQELQLADGSEVTPTTTYDDLTRPQFVPLTEVAPGLAKKLQKQKNGKLELVSAVTSDLPPQIALVGRSIILVHDDLRVAYPFKYMGRRIAIYLACERLAARTGQPITDLIPSVLPPQNNVDSRITVTPAGATFAAESGPIHFVATHPFTAVELAMMHIYRK